MSLRLKVSNIDLSIYGLHLDKGALSVFEHPPTPKEVFFNDWKDEDGFDYDDESAIFYEPQTFDIPFIMKADNLADYRKKRREFLDLIKSDFDFQILDWGETYKLKLIKVVKWEFISRVLEGNIFVTITLQLENNHVLPTYVFRYLADNQGRYIIINDNKRILVKTTYKKYNSND